MSLHRNARQAGKARTLKKTRCYFQKSRTVRSHSSAMS